MRGRHAAVRTTTRISPADGECRLSARRDRRGERVSARSRALVSPAPGLPRASPENGQEPNTSNIPRIRLGLCPIKFNA